MRGPHITCLHAVLTTMLYFVHVPVLQKMMRFGAVPMYLTSYLCLASTIDSIALKLIPGLLSVQKEYSFDDLI